MNIYGDDQTWINYFAPQNPTSFFGFSSLAAMIKYINALPVEKERGSGWKISDYHNDWTASRNMPHALTIARKGWAEGIDMAQEISTQLAGQNALERRRTHSIAGGSVNIGRMLSGNPKHMVSRPKQPGKKIVTFFVEGFISSGIDVENAICRAAIIGAIADVLEMNGYSCDIVSIITASDMRDRPAFQIATSLKSAGEPLNLNDVVFALGHPAYFRRLGFACVGSCDKLGYVYSSMGMPSRAFTRTHSTQSNELFVDKITIQTQRHIDDFAPLLTKARQIWNIVCKDKLPIQMKVE